VLWRVLRREVHLARLKADFVSNLSHELKTPLTSISMFTEMIREGRIEGGPEMREAVDVISEESERLQRIVSRMIDVARREAGATGYALVPGDLGVPVRAACERFRRLTREPGLDLSLDLAPALPPVALDAGAVDDAVTNLLSNAWKYRRGDAARVRVATRARGRRVEIVVEDDGIGIPRRERRRVFEMFYRADNYLSRTVPGTGLGLALVRTIVRVHRGRVRVESTPGGGSTFRLSFPRARARAGGAPASRPAPSAGAGSSESGAPAAPHGVAAR
jgi:signal transduction histidine kinase